MATASYKGQNHTHCLFGWFCFNKAVWISENTLEKKLENAIPGLWNSETLRFCIPTCGNLGFRV